MRTVSALDILSTAADLLDSDATGENPEYERAIVQMTRNTLGLDPEGDDHLIELLHAIN